ncbi:MAG: hypothetical protein WBC55_05535 [Dehalococcoidia bacterium]
MESAIVSLICIALIVLGGMTLSQSFLSSMDSSSVGLEEMSERAEDIMRTELTPLKAEQPSADTLEVTLKNSGQTKLSTFASWDIIIQYYDSGGTYHVEWLPYTEGTPGNNEWTDKGIYLDAELGTPEAFEPGILNTGEEIVLEIKLDPSVGEDTTNLIVVTTPNGIPFSVSFVGYK